MKNLEKTNLHDFCQLAIFAIDISTNKITTFIEWRYFLLAKTHPHATFSTNQGALNFFEQTLAHLTGTPFEETKNLGEFEKNYREWIKKHLQ